MERRQVHYSGRVQGVGFRYTTRSVATRFQVAGFVQNLPDGRVYLVVEGEPAELNQFMAAIQTELNHYIRNIQTETLPPTQEFSGFSIQP